MNTAFLAKSRALTAITILAFSIVPLVGILSFGWDWRETIVFYWLGNITAGIVTLTDMARLNTTIFDFSKSPTASEQQQIQQILPIPPVLSKLFAMGFFTVHFGGFTAVHGFFVFLIATTGAFGIQTAGLEPLNLAAIFGAWSLGALSYIVTRLLSPVPYLAARESINDTYRRVIVLHLGLIGGAFLIAYLQLPAAAAIVLIVFNMVSDLWTLRKMRPSDLATV
jgi:hypothetical protein